jgi:hypothetical protein
MSLRLNQRSPPSGISGRTPACLLPSMLPYAQKVARPLSGLTETMTRDPQGGVLTAGER